MARNDKVRRIAAWAVGLAVFCANAAHAGDIAISGAWARATVPSQTEGVVYLTIANTGKTGDALLLVSTPAAKRAEIHTTDTMDGMMMMRAAASLPIPAGGSLALKPGGDHIMLMGLQAPLKRGDTISLTLTFQRAGDLAVAVPVANSAP